MSRKLMYGDAPNPPCEVPGCTETMFHKHMKSAPEETIRRLNGFFVGSLSDDELAAFDRACEEGWAYRSYEGAGGFMGLAKVRLRP